MVRAILNIAVSLKGLQTMERFQNPSQMEFEGTQLIKEKRFTGTFSKRDLVQRSQGSSAESVRLVKLADEALKIFSYSENIKLPVFLCTDRVCSREFTRPENAGRYEILILLLWS